MLESLYVRNYRNLKEFKIKSLGQVNLITGKNNTGKSSVLEAISIYASEGRWENIFNILEQRGEIWRRQNGSENIESDLKTISSLFTGRKIDFKKDNAISISDLHRKKVINIACIRDKDQPELPFFDNIEADKKGYSSDKIALRISNTRGEEFRLPLGDGRIGRSWNRYSSSLEKVSLEYITSKNNNTHSNDSLFDTITLTEREKYIIEALHIIEPSAERIAFVDNGERARSAVIKLAGSNEILPLGSMGDGINRILSIILALVNCKDGYLLIDEIENGLHYTAQDKLWKIIFKLAKDLNIQVFATTHSEDCITSFGQVMDTDNKEVEGKLIRLYNMKGEIMDVAFTVDELRIATEQDIELR